MVFVYRASAQPLSEEELALLNEIEQTEPEEGEK